MPSAIWALRWPSPGVIFTLGKKNEKIQTKIKKKKFQMRPANVTQSVASIFICSRDKSWKPQRDDTCGDPADL